MKGKTILLYKNPMRLYCKSSSFINSLTEKKEFVLSKQILRSVTSIGANIHEAVSSVSKRDFIHKLGIALKEARETLYWLSLLKILNSIILTTKERYFKNIHNS